LTLTRFVMASNRTLRTRPDYEEYSPLHRVEEENLYRHLKEGANVNAVTKLSKTTPLHMAAKKAKCDYIKALIQHGAKVNARDKNGFTPLYYAVEKASTDCVRALLEAGSSLALKVNKEAFNLAVTGTTNYKEIVNLFLDKGYKIRDGKSIDLLSSAVRNGYLQIVESMMELGANVQSSNDCERNSSLLHLAVRNKQRDVARFLIQHKADVNAEDMKCKTPLDYALQNYDDKMGALLLRHGAVVDNDVQFLANVISKGLVQMVDQILQKGIDVNFQYKNGDTPLHIAAKYRTPWVLEHLLKKGANVHAVNGSGYVPMDYQIGLEHSTGVRLLLEYGADVNATTKYSNTPLHLACKNGDFQTVITLVQFGADPNITDRDGKTPVYNLELNSKKFGRKFWVQIFREAKEVTHQKHEDYWGELETFDKSEDDNHCSDDSGDYEYEYGSDSRVDYKSLEYNELFRKTFEILLVQILRLKSADFYVHEKNLQIIRRHFGPSLTSFVMECKKEVKSMKHTIVKNTNITFWDILTKNIRLRTIYSKNEHVTKALNAIGKRYLIYKSMLRSKVKQGEFRDKMLEKWNKGYALFGLPYDCTLYVFDYLSDFDLANLMVALQ